MKKVALISAVIREMFSFWPKKYIGSPCLWFLRSVIEAKPLIAVCDHGVCHIPLYSYKLFYWHTS